MTAAREQFPVMTADDLPKFDAPPVVETALSIQFSRLPEFTTAMAGWFWKSYLTKLADGAKWNKVVEVPRLEDEFEKFGEGDELVTLAELRQKLEAEFPKGYVGIVYYQAADSRWRAELQAALVKSGFLCPPETTNDKGSSG